MNRRGLFRRILKWTAIGIPVLLVAAFLYAWFTSTNACDEPAVTPKDPMKAYVQCVYGAPDLMQLRDVEKPVPMDNQVLVKVHAVSVNPLDWHGIRGMPYAIRPMIGLRVPAATGVGVDYSGTVEAVGKKVTGLEPGDEVFGARDGAFAEYVAARADTAVVKKPTNLSFEQAASVSVAAITALQALRDKAKIGPGQKVLINGASGGVGTFAVQIAKALGAHVTGVCSTRNLEMVKTIGADEVVDYTKEDFTKSGERYDAVIDNVVNRSLSEYRGVLKPGGRYVMIGGGGLNDHTWVGPFPRIAWLFLSKPFVSQEMSFFMAHLNVKDLTELGDLMQSGKVTPVIDRTYSLAELPQAVRYLEEGHARGKVVVTVP